MAWLLLLFTAAGCAAPTVPDTPGTVSPTSALYASSESEAPGINEPTVSGLTFTEVRSSGSVRGAYEGCEGEDWFELYNGGDAGIDLGRLFVTDDINEPENLRLPQVTLMPGEYLAVCGCGQRTHPAVRLGIDKAGEDLYICTAAGQVICSLSVPALTKDTSWALLNGTWGYCPLPTPGKENTAVYDSLSPHEAGNLPLQVSELLLSGSYTPVTEDGAYCDFVELSNASDSPLSLQGWYLSDELEDLTRFPLPDMTLAPGELLLVLLGGDGTPRTDGALQAPFTVGKEEVGVYLYSLGDMAYSLFSLPERQMADVSMGPNGAYYLRPTPGESNGTPSFTAADGGFFDSTGVFISEVCAFETDKNDWIELYNGSAQSVSLEGWTLGPERSGAGALALSGTLTPGAHLVVETTSHPERQRPGVGTFGISAGGETLYLLDEEGQLQDSFSTGALTPNHTSGRVEGNGSLSRVFFLEATPGKTNAAAYRLGYALAPTFSHRDLYQSAPFLLTLTADPEATIRYTTDGSEPDGSSKLYTGPIEIKKNTVVRAIATEDGLMNSDIVTYTYLFEEPHSLPVICLSFLPKDVDALASARSKESSTKKQRKGYFSYYEDGSLCTQFPADFKTKGAGTLGYRQMSLSIHLRGKYGQGSVNYPFFSEAGWAEYASLCIRNSGQDHSSARIRDSYASRLCYGLNIDVALTRPVVVYINGQYYGLYDLNEDQNDDYLYSHYGVNPDDVDIIRFNTSLVKGSKADWTKVINFAKGKDLSKAANYEQFIEWVDEDCFMDYLICSMYLCNSDMANQKYWHSRDNTVRWRPIFYDFDYAMGFHDGSAKRSIIGSFFRKEGTATATSRIYTHIAVALKGNKSWREKFIERYVELTVTTFKPERATQVLNQLKSEMEPEMRRHIARWGTPSSYESWLKAVNYIEDWMQKRPAYALQSLKEYFDLSQSEIDALVAKYSE
ncbi:MAG: CotH kinase family protein [Clostridia bacterium]|nr:CotH kinase family protein [Clostridia bacterium]